MSEMEIGDNSGTVLKNFCERYKNLQDELKAEKKVRKEKISELENEGLPIKAMIKLIKRDPEKQEIERQQEVEAGALLNIQVYTEATPVEEEVDEASATKAQQGVLAVRSIDERISEIGEDTKQLLKEVKAEGFVSSLIPRIVAIMEDPKAYLEGSLLMTTYLKAVGVTPA